MDMDRGETHTLIVLMGMASATSATSMESVEKDNGAPGTQ
jgi:hypothetical protein